MLTSEQIAQDIKALWTHLERVEESHDSSTAFISEDQHKAIFCKPKPFEFAKLEHWKPSKHAKR